MKKLLLLTVMMVFSVGAIIAQRTVNGIVVDEAGDPLIGATVVIKGTSVGTATDIDGNFSLSVPTGSNTLVVSYTGFNSSEMDITGLSSLSVTMSEASELLSEIVVTGYSEVQRSKLISSISVVSNKQLENIPMTDVNQLIQGRAPGVFTTANSGQPGAQQQVRIRGTGSITAGRGPLYVVDGIIMDQGSFSTLDASSNAVDALAQINPNDIESVSILKDASATALYGSRGSNGVIVINTKRGRAGKTEISVKAQTGVTMPSFGNFKLMNAQEQWDYERKVLANSGFEQDVIDQRRPASYLDNTANWLEEAFKDGSTYNVELQARGGNEKTRFFTSGGYFEQEGILIESAFNRATLRSNIDHDATDKLTFSLNVNGSYSENKNAVNGNRFQSPIAQAFTTTPMQGTTDPTTGEYYHGTEDDWVAAVISDNFLYSQPLNPVEVNTLRLISKLSASYAILENLKFTQSANIDFISVDELDYDDPTTGDGEADGGNLTNAYNNNRALTTQSMLKYVTDIGRDHTFDIFGVYEYQRINNKEFNAGGKGFASGKLKTLDSAAEPDFVGGNIDNYSFIGLLTQASYSFRNKYFLSGSFRRDGSSRFGANNRWANFWSVGGSWNISDETFMDTVSFLDNLRLKASYGTSGNAAIGNFDSQELYGFGAAYLNEPGSSPGQIGNPDLTWETSNNFNTGISFTLFDLLSAEVEFYNRVAEDLLLDVPVSSTSGFTTAKRNIGKMRNRGVEVTAALEAVKPKSAGGFSWDLNFNISFNKNEILELPNDEDINNGFQIYRVGYPIRSGFIQKWAGVNPADGTPLWALEGGGVTGVYNEADRFLVGNAEPDFIAGLTSTFRFKGLTLNAFFYTAQGHEIYNQSKAFLDSSGQRFGWVHVKEAGDHWENPGDISARPQPLVGGNKSSANTSTRFLEDGSFIRLRNVQLGYNLPFDVVNRAKLSGAYFYVQGQNLWTMTDYSGMDPEADEDGSEFFRYPVGKSITFGVDLTF